MDIKAFTTFVCVLAWPSILANVLFASVGVVALKAVGNLGTDAVAAVGTGGRIFFVIQSIMMAISTRTWKILLWANNQTKNNVCYQQIHTR